MDSISVETVAMAVNFPSYKILLLTLKSLQGVALDYLSERLKDGIAA